MQVEQFFKELKTLSIGGKSWFSDPVINKKWEVGRLEIRVSMRSKNGYMGRFGGGWNYKLGFQSGGKTLLVSLLVMNIILNIKSKEGESP